MAEPVETGSICVGCGLCCDGTLHGYTAVREEDESAAAAVGLKVVDNEGKRSFLQPCPHHSCGTCAVYADRPPVCRQYRCALLKSVEAGTVSSAEARERIGTATKLRSAILGAVPQARTPAARSKLGLRLKAELPSLVGEERSRAARLMLDLATLDRALDSWFRTKREPDSTDPASETAPAGESEAG